MNSNRKRLIIVVCKSMIITANLINYVLNYLIAVNCFNLIMVYENKNAPLF